MAAHLALRAGEHTRARDGFAEALAQLPPTARRQRMLWLIDQAAAELHTGDHPEACLHATRAAELLDRAPYAVGTARLRAFRAAARPLGRRALRILDTHLNHPAA